MVDRGIAALDRWLQPRAGKTDGEVQHAGR
jgi:hypothetical protein